MTEKLKGDIDRGMRARPGSAVVRGSPTREIKMSFMDLDNKALDLPQSGNQAWGNAESVSYDVMHHPASIESSQVIPHSRK